MQHGNLNRLVDMKVTYNYSGKNNVIKVELNHIDVFFVGFGQDTLEPQFLRMDKGFRLSASYTCYLSVCTKGYLIVDFQW